MRRDRHVSVISSSPFMMNNGPSHPGAVQRQVEGKSPRPRFVERRSGEIIKPLERRPRRMRIRL